MSKKRDKNARKKAVSKKPRPLPRAAEVPIHLPIAARTEPDWEAEFVEPPEATPDMARSGGGGGAIGSLRNAVTPRRGQDGDTLLTKRRSVPELMVWLAGAVGVIWAVWTLYQASQGDPQ